MNQFRLVVGDDRIQVSADVDLVGAKELVAKLQRRIILLEKEAASVGVPDFVAKAIRDDIRRSRLRF